MNLLCTHVQFSKYKHFEVYCNKTINAAAAHSDTAATSNTAYDNDSCGNISTLL